jgi:hypothetical protein
MFSCKAPPNLTDLWGIWQGTGQGQNVMIKFQEDGECRLVFQDMKTGERRRFKGEFQADFTKHPIPISIRSIPELPHALHTIVDFQTDGSLLMSQFSTSWRLRPISFEQDKTLLLTKSTQNN